MAFALISSLPPASSMSKTPPGQISRPVPSHSSASSRMVPACGSAPKPPAGSINGAPRKRPIPPPAPRRARLTGRVSGPCLPSAWPYRSCCSPCCSRALRGSGPLSARSLRARLLSRTCASMSLGARRRHVYPPGMIDDVLAQYPATLCNWKVTPLGSHGGFSGARLWRVDGLAGAFCLKGWPTSVVDRQRLAEVHRLMLVAGDRGLAFVPHVVPTRTGKTFVREAGRFWDVTTWLPGHADFRERPETPRLAAACRALAQLHLAWADQ